MDIAIMDTVVFRNVGLRGGVSPARVYIPELMNDVLNGVIDQRRSSTSKPTLIMSVRRTPPWMTGERSSRFFVSVASRISVERRCRFWTEPTRGFPVSTGSRRAGARDKL